MNKDEILQTVSPKMVLADRGIKVVRGMCSCPFHGHDKNPSMKVYKDGFNCFACGWKGNVIDFVMKYDGCNFKAAYVRLGGTYKSMSPEEREQERRRLALVKKKNEEKLHERKDMTEKVNFMVNLLKAVLIIYNPTDCMWDIDEVDYPQDWVDAQNDLPIVWDMYERVHLGKEINKEDVDRQYKRIVERCLTVR